MIPEKEREALMRLTMCARHQCEICKYRDKYTRKDCMDEIMKDMHILMEAVEIEMKDIVRCGDCIYWPYRELQYGSAQKCTEHYPHCFNAIGSDYCYLARKEE